MWIPALGVVIFFGFFNNCALYPIVECEVISWEWLIMTFLLLLGWGGARDVILRKYIYLGPILDGAKKAKGWLTNKVWIPAIGWCLVLGFGNNIILHPYGITPREVEWYGLFFALAVLLTASGFRDVGIVQQENKHNPEAQPPTAEQSEDALPADF